MDEATIDAIVERVRARLLADINPMIDRLTESLLEPVDIRIDGKVIARAISSSDEFKRLRPPDAAA